MKKKLLFAALATISYSVCAFNSEINFFDKIVESSSLNKGNECKVFDTYNGYDYAIETPINSSLDSFEAWVKLPNTSIGGTILGNYFYDSAKYNVVNFEVAPNGKVGFSWNDGSIKYTFNKSKSIIDNTRHHIAITRTDSEFKYYLDGNLEETYNIKSTKSISNAIYKIGVDNASWHASKKPFGGQIKQITLYEGAISEEQIKSDMTNEIITASSTPDTKPLGNWVLGETWSKRFIDSTVANTPRLSLNTHEKYVGADYSFGEYDYTFIIVPDIQIMTNYNPQRLNNAMQWIVDNKEKMNIQFATFVGDLADRGKYEEEYQKASSAMSKLDNVVPYCFVPGNHDYNDNFGSRNTEYLNKYFPYSKHSKLPGFGGAFEEGKIENNYYLFDCEGEDYLVINLEYRPRKKVLNRAQRVLEQYPNHRAIISTHDNLKPDGLFTENVSAGFEVTSSQKMFDGLVKKYPNVFLNIGGHYCGDDIVRRTDYGINGNKITSMIVDGQVTKYKGETAQDMMLLVHVKEDQKIANCVYYSPEQDACWNLQNQFELNFKDSKNPALN